jgi:hypothetical protein
MAERVGFSPGVFYMTSSLQQDTVKMLINQVSTRFTIGRNFNHRNLNGTNF